MSGAREAIFADIEARLRDALPDAEIERMPSGDPSGFPALGIIDRGHGPTEFEAGTTRYQLDITIDGYVESGGGSAAHAAMNDLYEAVKAALITEPPLGGLVESIDEGDFTADVAALASQRRVGFQADFQIIFSTGRAL